MATPTYGNGRKTYSRWATILMLALPICGCGHLPTAEDLDRWKGETTQILGQVSKGVEKATALAKQANDKVAEIKAGLQTTADVYAAKGAPVDRGGTAFAKWLAENPGEASGSAAGLLLALYAGWTRRKATAAQTALAATSQAIENAGEAGAAVKANTMVLLAKATPAHAAIANAKLTV